MCLEHEAAPVDIDPRVALAPLDLLAGVVAMRASGLGRLDALAVDDRGGRTDPAGAPPAIRHDQSVIDLLKAAVLRKSAST